MNNFEDIVNRRVNIQEDIKRYQDTLSYTSSKADYSVGQSIYMLPSDMKLKIRSGTVRYNNKILVSDGNFSQGKNDDVNSLETVTMKSYNTNSVEPTKITAAQGLTHTPAISQKKQEPHTITHNEDKIAFVLFMAGGFAIWNIFR